MASSDDTWYCWNVPSQNLIFLVNSKSTDLGLLEYNELGVVSVLDITEIDNHSIPENETTFEPEKVQNFGVIPFPNESHQCLLLFGTESQNVYYEFVQCTREFLCKTYETPVADETVAEEPSDEDTSDEETPADEEPPAEEVKELELEAINEDYLRIEQLLDTLYEYRKQEMFNIQDTHCLIDCYGQLNTLFTTIQQELLLHSTIVSDLVNTLKNQVYSSSSLLEKNYIEGMEMRDGHIMNDLMKMIRVLSVEIVFERSFSEKWKIISQERYCKNIVCLLERIQ